VIFNLQQLCGRGRRQVQLVAECPAHGHKCPSAGDEVIDKSEEAIFTRYSTYRCRYIIVPSPFSLLSPRANSSVVSGDMIGDCGDMRPDATCGICQRGAVLDLHSDERVCVVRAPNLRTIVQHAGIEAATLKTHT
jgi:hypothetical protein